MKYNQPYGVSDPDAPYTNGNPATGARGSIPPAASIEYPQREIVNFINDTGAVLGAINPTNSNLRQLSECIQLGSVHYADDVGTPGAVVVNLTPELVSLRKGVQIWTVLKYKNTTGPATLKVNTWPPRPILHLDGTAMTVNELKNGMLALFCYDGNSWQWVSAPYVPVITGVLQAPENYYVNDTTGNDSNDGLTEGTAFKTINKGISMCIKVNLNGYDVQIHVADGIYRENVRLHPLNGNGVVHLIGDTATPAACTIAPNTGPAIYWADTFAVSGWSIRGFKVTAVANGAQPGSGISGSIGSITLADMEFGPCIQNHLSITHNCRVLIAGPGNTWRISGNAVNHINIGGQSEIVNFKPALLITGTPAFTIFAVASGLSMLAAEFTSIGGSATGIRYSASQNAIINTGGAGPTYLPGNASGVLATGGQYI